MRVYGKVRNPVSSIPWTQRKTNRAIQGTGNRDRRGETVSERHWIQTKSQTVITRQHDVPSNGLAGGNSEINKIIQSLKKRTHTRTQDSPTGTFWKGATPTHSVDPETVGVTELQSAHRSSAAIMLWMNCAPLSFASITKQTVCSCRCICIYN